MKKVILDFKLPDSQKKVQEYLALVLDFPDYYGENLDALYDELTSITEDTCIGVFMPDEDIHGMVPYLKKVQRVLQDAELDNEHICVFFNEMLENFREE